MSIRDLNCIYYFFWQMCSYYKFREENKNYYEKVRPIDLRHVGDENIMTLTPYRDQHGHRILIYRFGIWKPSRVTVDDIFKATIVLQELGSLEPISQIVGGVAIFDLKDLGLEHLLHLSPSVAQKMIALLVVCILAPLFSEKLVRILISLFADFHAHSDSRPAYCQSELAF